MENIRSWVALQSVLCTKPLVARTLCDRFGSPEAILRAPQASLDATNAEWAALQSLRGTVDWPGVDAALQYCEAHRVQIVTRNDPTYPTLLQECADPPVALFVQGIAAVLQRQPMVAIVGARKSTPYGREVTEGLVHGLVAAGVTVVSGLALGIDGVAHRAALASDGVTIGVLGSGFAQFYPSAHQGLAAKMVQSGVVITEFLPDIPAFPQHFPQRNRLISGMSLAVVVVEAAQQSGSLVTARYAAEQGRLVFAVPGRVGDITTRGTHNLLRQGALMAETAQDILDGIAPLYTATCQPPGEDAMGRALLPCLAEAQGLDVLVERAGQSVGAVLAWLTQMECAGTVRVLPGNRYIRVAGGMA